MTVIAAPGHDAITALLATGHKLNVTRWRVAGAWYAEIRTPKGFWLEGGYGPTVAAALAHLDSRLARKEHRP